MPKPTLVPTLKSSEQIHLFFDDHPVKLDGFELHGVDIVVTADKPTIRQWQVVMAYASGAAESAPYWVGALVNYAESRADWQEKLSQAMTITGLARQTIINYAHTVRHVGPAERAIAQSPAHSAVVAKIKDPGEQRDWLERSREEGWNAAEFGQNVRARRRPIISGNAPLKGMFPVWYVDCPWKYGDSQPSGSSAKAHFPPMTIEQLCAMGDTVRAHVTSNAVGFFWVTAPILYDNPGPREVIEAWGFEPKTGMIWDKVKHNYGHYVSGRHEHLIIATRGSKTPDRPTPMPDSVVTLQNDGEHSEKPELFRKIIEKLYDGPYVEMFAREQVEGWTCWGNQIMVEAKSA